MKNGYIKNALCYIAGSIIYAAAVAVILSPNHITPGGVTGVATVLYSITGIPSGLFIALFNIPLLIMAFKKMGGGFVLRTVAATFLVSLFLSLAEAFLPKYAVNPILAAVFGGVLAGFGIAVIMLRSATTGGVDLAAMLINLKKPHLSVGRVIMVCDFFVCALSGLVYKNIESALYSLISIYAASRIIDSVLYGADRGKQLLIISEKGELLCKSIGAKLSRGATLIPAVGGYTGKSLSAVFCAVRAHETAELIEVVRATDSAAFITVADAGQIIGQGFRKY